MRTRPGVEAARTRAVELVDCDVHAQNECGFAWLAPLLWRFVKDWNGVWREVPWVTRRPSEYVREHFRFTTAPVDMPALYGIRAA